MDKPWSSTATAIAGSFHSSAILSTLFRLWYRWSKSRIWWDDVWAIMALFANTVALISVLLVGTDCPRLVVSWLIACSFPTIMWTTRISILVSIVRVSQPEGVLRRTAIGVGLTFGTMWSCVFAQRLQNCICYSCAMTMAVAIAQIATGCFADVLLVTLPIIFLRKVQLCRKRKILIFTAFSSSTIINIVTIVQATYLFNKPATTLSVGDNDTVIVAYVKTALSVIVCNLLVIVTFIYRVLHKGQADLDAPSSSTAIEFTTVDLSLEDWSAETSKRASIPARSCSTTRSSTWSYRPMGSLVSKLSGVVVGTSRADTIQSDVIIEEER